MNAEPKTANAGHPGDTQKVELLGRNRLIDELLRDDLEIALPVRDRGIDLIAYVDLDSASSTYVACPIQMKAAWTRSFVIEKKYAKFPRLVARVRLAPWRQTTGRHLRPELCGGIGLGRAVSVAGTRLMDRRRKVFHKQPKCEAGPAARTVPNGAGQLAAADLGRYCRASAR